MMMLPMVLALIAGAEVQAHTSLDGLDVVVVPIAGAPCSVRLAVRAGADEDPKGMGGLAHVVEHLTFGGARGRTVMLSNHATINAMTTAGGTVFSLETAAAYCEAELTSLLSMVTDGKLRRSWFGPEMEVIAREALYRSDTRAILDTALFGNTAAVVIGSQTTREQIKHVDVVRFFQNYYVPENMALIAVGGIDAEAVRRALATGFKLAPSLPSERSSRPARPILTHGESKVIGLRAGLVTLVAPLPLEAVVLCRSMAALLRLRLEQRLAPGTTAIVSDCRTMEGNLLLAVILSTERDDQERVRNLAIKEWNGFRAPSAVERALLTRRFANQSISRSASPHELAEDLAASALWLRGEVLFKLAPAWLATGPAADADLKAAALFTSAVRSSVFLGDQFVQR